MEQKERMKRTRGVTMIELLTVISIIAILSAITVPVFSTAKVNANRSSDITAMNDLRTAVLLYRADQGAFPPALLGYATLYSADTSGVVPADQLRSHLYPSLNGSLSTFQPKPLRAAPGQVATAVWPNFDPRPVGTAPIDDLNGDGRVDGADDEALARQAFNHTAGMICGTGFPMWSYGGACRAQDGVRYFYNVSGYDTAEVRTQTQVRRELRYARFWTRYGFRDGSVTDDPRQLGYSEPPDSTVVTWNSFYRNYQANGQVADGRQDIVLTLGGAARPVSSKLMAERSWRIKL
jgi:prepilin-type N-terminal cleavage/methylation domain-containing protein